jgi:hypothetical protein
LGRIKGDKGKGDGVIGKKTKDEMTKLPMT